MRSPPEFRIQEGAPEGSERQAQSFLRQIAFNQVEDCLVVLVEPGALL